MSYLTIDALTNSVVMCCRTINALSVSVVSLNDILFREETFTAFDINKAIGIEQKAPSFFSTCSSSDTELR